MLFFLHLHTDNLPPTFGGVSRYLFRKIFNSNCKQIHVVFDTFVSPSNKDCERKTRGRSMSEVKHPITGPGQSRPRNWKDNLCNNSFKKAFADILVSSWLNDDLVESLQDKILYANHDDVCFAYWSEENKMARKKDKSLFCTHEEADSRLIYHLKNADPNSRVVLRTNDTDVLVITLGCFNMLPEHLMFG